VRKGGFSLIEMMIVVALIGILGAVAYPSYQDYLQKSRRTDGMTALLTLANEQEKYYLDNNSYATALSLIWDVSGQGAYSADDYYDIAVVSADASGYVVRATPAAAGKRAGIQANDTDCLCFTFNQLGQKAAFPTAGCSGTDHTQLCWGSD
jgi:type IV pilus assembly protein PilE